MLEKVCAEIIDALRGAGIDAREKYSGGDVREVKKPCIFVGISGMKACAAGIGHYLGIEEHDDMTHSELYGLRCEIEIALDICAPANTGRCAGTCAGLFDEALAALSGLEGLSIQQANMSDGTAEAKSGLYKCPCMVRGSAFIVAESDEGAEFADFVLKGVLKNEC